VQEESQEPAAAEQAGPSATGTWHSISDRMEVR